MALRQNLIEAVNMYDIFTFWNTEAGLPTEGLDMLKNNFNNIDDVDKPFVFALFLQFLQDEGIEYDVAQFQAA